MEQNQNLSVPMAIIVAGVIVALAIVFTRSPAGNTSVVDDNGARVAEENIKIKEVSSDDHLRGDISAPLKIVEFSDTECPFCKAFHETMKTIIAEYPGQVAWVYRHFPLDLLHKKARREAEATECAAKLGGNEIFWDYTDLVFETTTSNDGLDPNLLPEFAARVGLDKAAFQSCLDGGETKALVEAHEQDAKLSGGNGTPHSILILENGKTFPVRGALPVESMRAIIDAALAGKL